MRLIYFLTSSRPGFHRRSVLFPTVVTIKGRGLVVTEYSSLPAINDDYALLDDRAPQAQAGIESRPDSQGSPDRCRRTWAIRHPPVTPEWWTLSIWVKLPIPSYVRVTTPIKVWVPRHRVAERVPSLPCESRRDHEWCD